MKPEEPKSILSRVVPWLVVIVAVYVLLVAVGVIGKGFRQVSGGTEGVESLFAFATNPFVGLVLGILATALIQSSSTVTSIIVGLVAGGMPIAIAHFLYNLLGVVVIYSIPQLRRIPMAGAEWIAQLGSERKGWALAYILSVFFGLPGALVFSSAWLH